MSEQNQNPAAVAEVHFGAVERGDFPAAMALFSPTVTGPSMVNDDLVAVPVRFAGTRGDASMDMAGVDLLTVRDGKIIEVHLLSEDGAAEDVV